MLRPRALVNILVVEHVVLIDTSKKENDASTGFVCQKYEEIFYRFWWLKKYMNRLLSKQYKESMVMEFGREMSVLEAKMWDEKVLVLLRPVLSVESADKTPS